ncbi:MAG: erythromycin esterase family protein, partial [Solirubrobacteraceae bacterium]
AYGSLSAEVRDALTAGLVELTARLTGRRLAYVRVSTAKAYDRALQALRLTISLDAGIRRMAAGDREAMMFTRDAALAETVETILRRENRIVLAAHNGHIQRWPLAIPGLPGVTPMGMHLADSLGAGYRVIGTTSGSGQILNTGPDFYTGTLFTELAAPRPGSIDALMSASYSEPFATDLRQLSAADAATVHATTQQRAGIGDHYSQQSPLDAFDVLIHIPYVTAADPDETALAHAPQEVQQNFANWEGR